MWLSQGSTIQPPSMRTATQTTEGLRVTRRNGLKCNAKHRGLQSEHRWGNRRSPQLTRQERLWWLLPTVIFWWYAIFILYRMEGHNLHYADKSIIHEQNSSQNSKTQLFDPRITAAHPFLLSSSSPLSGLLSYTEWALGSTCRGAPASAVPGRSRTRMPPSSGKYRHTQEMWISDD